MQHPLTPVVVGLCGPRRSGKDTAAEYLVQEHGFTNLKLASRLKQALKVMFQLTDAHIEGPLKDATDPDLGTTPRKLMQWLGTGAAQVTKAGCLVWVNATIKEIRDHHQGGHVVISDVRFHHEVAALKRAFPHCILVHLERSQQARGPLGPDDQHASEVEAAELQGDVTLPNDGSIEDLHAQLARIIASHGASQTPGTAAWSGC